MFLLIKLDRRIYMFYAYDGTFEGLLSAVTVYMRSCKGVSDACLPPLSIVKTEAIPPLLQYETIKVIPGIMDQFGEYLRSHFGDLMAQTIYHAFLSEQAGIENAITEYILLARKIHADPCNQLYRDCVKKVTGSARTVTGEVHRYLGLLRFRKKIIPIASDKPSILFPQSIPEIYIAECEPVTLALPLMAEHFAERFPNQCFIIFDKRRKLCVTHLPGNPWTMQEYEDALLDGDQFETRFEEIWQTYFKVLTIPERINPKLQKGNMPKRYWKYLIEEPGQSGPSHREF